MYSRFVSKYTKLNAEGEHKVHVLELTHKALQIDMFSLSESLISVLCFLGMIQCDQMLE